MTRVGRGVRARLEENHYASFFFVREVNAMAHLTTASDRADIYKFLSFVYHDEVSAAFTASMASSEFQHALLDFLAQSPFKDLNAGLDKEKLIATKTANSFFMGLSQIGSYTFFGLLEGELWIYGICIGLGATIGNIIGKRLLGGMSSRQFRYALIALMVISGVLMIRRILSQIMS